MSDIMFFFTANMPGSVFSQLFDESQTAENAVPFLTLIRTPDQQEVDEWGTEPPIDDFETGFLGKTDDELRCFFRQFLAERPPSSQGNIGGHWMAVLDELSAAQSTIVLHYGMKKPDWDEIYQYEPEKTIPGTGKVCEDGYIWWKWRVPFKHSYHFYMTIEHCDIEVMEMFCRPEYVDSDGVVDCDTCYKILYREIRDPLGLVGGEWEVPSDA
ncbi:hypothetical protein BO94DRAFT_540435 [Aspergillus sclerotioniger CBS 115572]|uniref:Uncharacterized protein n=1 Tax=Aspergillus sclerotioniger CBS 115572 TaxID=1450535 RepID=A0A317V0R7_9EURO|nr:hypothetical protein BO94DRAFT_540435 [Aspergillus sclerotioniger CBS 115572]PWY67645.1 hypothetical protein BO94DRAFT_540435 [Aspergillus sclerotioniger CBS 115572]